MSPSVLVTGGGSGIGASIARRMAAAGFDVCVVGRRRAALEVVADEVGGIAVAADTTDPEAATGAVEECLARFGRLDALAVSAGTGASGTVGEQTVERWNHVIETNLTGAFIACRAALPHLLEAGGALVTVSSLAGLRADPASAAYCASKAGLIMLTKCVALDYGPLGVRANCVCPGWIRTAIADAEMDALARRRGIDREAAYATAVAEIPARRPGTADEVAEAVAWLLSASASYINGAVVTVDGGCAVVDVGTLAFGPQAASEGEPEVRQRRAR